MRQASLLLSSVILVKCAFPPGEIGIYEQLFFVQYALSFFWVSGLIQALLSMYPRLAPLQQEQFLVAAYLVMLSISILLTGMMYGGSKPLLHFLTGQAELPHYTLFLFQQLLHLPTFLLEYLLLLRRRPRAIIGFGALSFGGALLAIGIPAMTGRGLEGVFWGFTLLGFIKHSWLIYEISCLKGTWKYAWPTLGPWLSLALPLMAYTFLGGLIQAYGGWSVNRYYAGDSAQFALFRYGAREFPLIIALSEALNAALVPLVAGRGAESFAEIRHKTLRLMHLIFPISILLLASSQYWFTWIFNSEFKDSIPVLNAFFLLAISRVVFPRAILIGLRDNRAVLAFSVLEFGLLAVAAAYLLPVRGIQGVALATVIAFWAEKALQIARLKYRFGIDPDTYIPMAWWLGYSVLMLAVYSATL
ncbi:MAG: hypothetical protein RL386_1337 [Bacteroidota bacterium]|jgi:hypothetical protein